MGQVLYEYYVKAQHIGGLPGKMLFAGLTKIASTQAKLLGDTPEMIQVFENCLSKLKSDLKVDDSKNNLNVVKTPHLKISKEGEDADKTAKRLRNNIATYLDIISQRSLFIKDLTSTFSRITEASVQALDCERVSIWMYNDTKSQIECKNLYVRSESKHSEGIVLNASDFPIYFNSIKNERTLATSDANLDPRTSEFSDVYLKPLGITAMLDVPIWYKNEMVGIICHEHVGPQRDWLEDEENYAFLMANFISIALELKA